MTLPAPALLGERMWLEAESSGAYSCYEDFVEDTVPYLRKEMGEESSSFCAIYI
jgi:hypothetical protein